MFRKLCSALAVAAAAATLLTVSGSPARASDVATVGCTQIFAEYTTGPDSIRIEYVEASNICHPYKGWFVVGGAEGPETDPIQTFKRPRHGEIVPLGAGGYDCAESYERKPDGSFVKRDEVCIYYP